MILSIVYNNIDRNTISINLAQLFYQIVPLYDI